MYSYIFSVMSALLKKKAVRIKKTFQSHPLSQTIFSQEPLTCLMGHLIALQLTHTHGRSQSRQKDHPAMLRVNHLPQNYELNKQFLC